MCGIAGVISKNGEDSVAKVRVMLGCMVHRGPDGAGIVADGRIVKSDSIKSLDMERLSGRSAIGHTRLAIVGGTCGAQPFRSCDGRFTLEHNGEIYNYKDLRAGIDQRKAPDGTPRHILHTQTDSELIVHILEDNFNRINTPNAKSSDVLISAIRMTVAVLDGVYAIVIRDEVTGDTVLVRDRLGVRQLYYAQDSSLVAFASERKALWKIGISEPTQRVMPCEAVLISEDGAIERYELSQPVPPVGKLRYKTMSGAVSAYKQAFMNSMKKRTQDFDSIGIIFSGGIDSVMVAHAAKQLVPSVVCYTCGIRGSHDTTFARQIAKQLDLDLRVCELDQIQVENLVPEVLNVIEDSNSGQVEVALPVYGAVKLASVDGVRVMLTGQGADELFGGYSWYSRVAEKEGYRKLRSHMMQDLLLLYKETLEREDKITMANSIELREPFLDPEVIRVAMECSLRLNIRDGRDMYGKRVHRNLARALGIPKEIAYRVKEAAQHGSGMHGMLDAIARKNGFDEHAVTKVYLEALRHREKIGSSQRYGYLFGEKKIWDVEPHVQMYLDSIAQKVTPLLAPVNVPHPSAVMPARAPAARSVQRDKL